MDHWCPIQVKQTERAGRPDIYTCKTVMERAERSTGFFVAFDYSSDALRAAPRRRP